MPLRKMPYFDYFFETRSIDDCSLVFLEKTLDMAVFYEKFSESSVGLGGVGARGQNAETISRRKI